MMLQLTFGSVDVQVSTTSTLQRLLAATHVRHCSTDRDASSRLVSVRISPPDRSPELALRDAQREIAGHVAAVGGWLAIDAVVVEREGRALALIGAAGSGKSTIAAHLLGRGWRLLADGVAFVDVAQSLILAHHGLMIFRSGAIPHLPSAFRSTLERSRWFVDESGELQFYEVDPATAFGAGVWSGEAILDALVFIDEHAGTKDVRTLAAETSTLRTIDGTEVSLSQFAGLRVGVIRKDRSVHTADCIEHWFDAHVGA
jgi:hypothetical protein